MWTTNQLAEVAQVVNTLTRLLVAVGFREIVVYVEHASCTSVDDVAPHRSLSERRIQRGEEAGKVLWKSKELFVASSFHHVTHARTHERMYAQSKERKTKTTFFMIPEYVKQRC